MIQPGRGRGGRGRGSNPALASHTPVPDAQSNNVNPDVATAPAPLSEADGKSECACGMCGVMVGEEGIGCDRCSAWFHPTEICSGLPREAISLITVHQADNSVLFVCTGCRINPGTGAWSTKPSRRRGSDKADEQEMMIKQLYLTVKGLCASVASLTSKFDALMSAKGSSEVQTSSMPSQLHRGSPTSHGTLPTTQTAPEHHSQQPSQYRSVIRQEIKELREREKRKDSVIVRGLTSSTLGDVVKEFGEITSTLIGSRVVLSDVVRIPDHPELIRAKITDEGKRKQILEKAKTLKGSRYDGVFIRRDLTYAQRQELKLRREGQGHRNAEQHPDRSQTPHLTNQAQQTPAVEGPSDPDRGRDPHPSQEPSNE